MLILPSRNSMWLLNPVCPYEDTEDPPLGKSHQV
jgi:hypothetical protein